MQRLTPPTAHRREAGCVRLRPSRSHRAGYVLRALAREMRSAARTVEPGSLILDYGCGDRPYEPLFLERGSRYFGADLAANGAADLMLSEGGAIPLRSGSVDAVVSSQVLEHVGNPERYLAEAARVLKPSGMLILSTHGIWRYHPDPHDFWRWTSAGLRRLVEESGFRIEGFRGIVGLPAAGIQLWQDALYGRMPRVMRPFFALIVQFGITMLDRMTTQRLRDEDAAVYLVIAKKSRPKSGAADEAAG